MYKTILRITFVLIALIFISQRANAVENTLRSIEVSENFDGYHLVLKTDKLAHSTKAIENPNKVYYELDNVKAQDNIKTTYKNTKKIEGVVIQQNGNKLRIYLDGDNVKNSSLTFETPTQTVLIKNPKEAGNNLTFYVFFVLIGSIFLMFKKLLSKIKRESESGYANKLLRKENNEGYISDKKTGTTNPINRGATTIKLIERNRELYASSRKTA